MSSMTRTARSFFDACETGEGWEGCAEHCHPDATFSAQAGPLAEVGTVQEYTDWMKGLVATMPDAECEVRSFAVDFERNNVSAYAVFQATHTEEGGPVPPTGERVESDYVYVMQFDGTRISHLTKIWNSSIALKQLGWA